MSDPTRTILVSPDGDKTLVADDQITRPEIDQPSPVKSDGVVRDIVDPYTGNDTGGNPLQEGIWAGIDGGWKPDGKRDESFASKVMNSNIIRSSYPKLGAQVVTPGNGGIHGGPLNLLGKLKSVSVDGIPVNQENWGSLYQTYGTPEGAKFGQPVQVTAHHPAFEDLAAKIIVDATGDGSRFSQDLQAIHAGIKSGQIPPPVAPSAGIVARISRKTLSLNHPYDQYQQGGWLGTPEEELSRHYQDAENTYKSRGWDSARDQISPRLRQIDDERSAYGIEPAHDIALKEFGQNLRDVHGGDAPSMWGGESAPVEGPQTPWEPGVRGRGLIIDGQLHTWPTIDPNNPQDDDLGLTHSEYVKSLGIDPSSVDFTTGVEIHPDGSVESTAGRDVSNHIAQDNRLTPYESGEDDLFNFESSIAPQDYVSGYFKEPVLANHYEMPWWVEDPVIDTKESSQKTAFAPALALGAGMLGRIGVGALAKKVLPGMVGGMLGNSVSGEISGGGSDPADVGGEQIGPGGSGVEYYSATFDLSNPGFSEAEDGDTKQFDDESSDTNFDNPNRDVDGAPTTGEDEVYKNSSLFGDDSEALLRAQMLLPLILHYYQAGEGGADDPMIISLHEMFENESPGYSEVSTVDEADLGSLLEALLGDVEKSDDDSDTDSSEDSDEKESKVASPIGMIDQYPGRVSDPSAATPVPDNRFVKQVDVSQVARDLEPQGMVDQNAPITPEEEQMRAAELGRIVASGEADFLVDHILDSVNNNGGITISISGDEPTQGFAVAPDKSTEYIVPLNQLNDSVVRAFIERNSGLLSQPGNYLGVWVEGGKAWFDISTVFPDVESAQQAAIAADQEAVFDLSTGESIYAHEFNKVANDHQGPVTKEQQSAVAELLAENGRHNEIIEMIRSPWNYAEELAQVSAQEGPPLPPDNEGLTQAPPDPAQEVAPPGDTMPVPNPADADPTLASTKTSQMSEWVDSSQNPLSVGETYEVYSSEYSIPDVIKIVAVKPDQIIVETIGDYYADGVNMPHSYDISLDEANLSELKFVPSRSNTSDTPDVPPMPVEPASEINTEPMVDEHEDPRIMASSHERSWLDDDGSISKSSGANYTRGQQSDFINETGVARNMDKLDLAGTHYPDNHASFDDDDLLFL